MTSPFAEQYPNIDRWLNEHDGRIQIGYTFDIPIDSFICAFDQGGMLWEGKSHYATLDEALQDLNDGLAEVMRELYGD
jgi:hypothetical protein